MKTILHHLVITIFVTLFFFQAYSQCSSPDVNQPVNQTLCTGSNAAPVNFAGSLPGTIFKWTNDDIRIGLAASGIGDIPSFITTNNTGNGIKSTITLTPYASNVPLAYIPNYDSKVSVVNVITGVIVGSSISVGKYPDGVATAPDGSKVYVANWGSDDISVLARPYILS